MLSGSCLCGRNTYEIHGRIHSARYCHCRNCRKFSGTAYAAWGVVRAQDLVVSGAQPSVAKYDSGGGLRAFCSACGSPLWFEPFALQEIRGIPLGTIDEGEVPAPEMHVWTKSSVAWAEPADALPKHDTHP